MKINRSPWTIKTALPAGAVIFAAATVLAGCGSGGGALSPLTEVLTRAFFPLNTGDTRVYRQTITAGGTTNLTQTVGVRETVNGLEVFPLATGQAGGTVDRVDYKYLDGPEGVAWVGSDEGANTLRLTPPVLIPVNLAPGQVVQQTVSVVGTGAFAAVKSLTSTARFVGVTTVTVPAGTFGQSAQLEMNTISRDGAGAVVMERSATTFLAPQVGIVKVISSLGTTNELTSATIAGTNIP